MTVIASCSLRRLEERDLELVRSWRNSDRIRSVMYSDNLISADEQRRWFEGLRSDPNRVYLIFEVNGQAVGLVDFKRGGGQNRAEWGFYIGDDNAPAGSGEALGEQGLAFGFNELGLEEILGETFAFNERGIRF